MMEWISVKDRLPKEGLFVLIYYLQSTDIARLDKDYWVFIGNDGEKTKNNEFIYWMPLPEPPNQ